MFSTTVPYHTYWYHQHNMMPSKGILVDLLARERRINITKFKITRLSIFLHLSEVIHDTSFQTEAPAILYFFKSCGC